ncbi:hypothetical protein RFI_30996, partial [Reticulomyxa filosa]
MLLLHCHWCRRESPATAAIAAQHCSRIVDGKLIYQITQPHHNLCACHFSNEANLFIIEQRSILVTGASSIDHVFSYNVIGKFETCMINAHIYNIDLQRTQDLPVEQLEVLIKFFAQKISDFLFFLTQLSVFYFIELFEFLLIYLLKKTPKKILISQLNLFILLHFSVFKTANHLELKNDGNKPRAKNNCIHIPMIESVFYHFDNVIIQFVLLLSLCKNDINLSDIIETLSKADKKPLDELMAVAVILGNSFLRYLSQESKEQEF